MNKAVYTTIFLGISAILALWFTANFLPIVYVFIPGVLISMVFYFRTAYFKAPYPDKLLPLYLLALGIQMLHFAEEYLTHFNVKVAQLFGHDPYPLDALLAFNMVAYFFFILGGIILYKMIRELMFIPLSFILLGVVFNGVVHLATAIYSGGYFPGLYTGLIYLVLGPMLLRTVWKETRVHSS
jgi:hypothetical protein